VKCIISGLQPAWALRYRTDAYLLPVIIPRAHLGVKRSPGQKLHRLPLQLALPPLILFKDGARAGAEGAVIEVDYLGIEKEFRFKWIGHLSRAPCAVVIKYINEAPRWL